MRGYLLRKNVEMLNEKATLIQKNFNGYRQRQEFNCAVKSIILVQSIYRLKKEVRNIHRLRCTIVKIQSLMRGCFLRKEVKTLHYNAAIIQSFFRGYLGRRKYHSDMRNIVIVQRLYRRNRVRQIRAVTLIQSMTRGYILRQIFKLHISRIIGEDTRLDSIQFSWWTEHKSENSHVPADAKQEWYVEDALIADISESWRKDDNEKSSMTSEERYNEIIQATVVCNFEKQRDKSVSTTGDSEVQHKIRKLINSFRFDGIDEPDDAVEVGSMIADLVDYKSDASSLTKALFSDNRDLRNIQQQQSVIDPTYSSHRKNLDSPEVENNSLSSEEMYKEINHATDNCNHQARCDKILFSGNTEKHREIQDLNNRPSFDEFNKQFKAFEQMTTARLDRVNMFENTTGEEIVNLTSIASVELNRIQDGKEITFRPSANAILIQKIYRGYIQRRKYLSCLIGIILIQMSYRQKIARREADQALTLIIRLQSISRSFMLRKRLSNINEKAKIVQKYFRRFIWKQQYTLSIKRTIMLQTLCRRKVAVREFRNICCLIIQTQSICRGYLVRKKNEALGKSAAVVQKVFRGYTARRRYPFQLKCHFDLKRIILVQSIQRQRQQKEKLKRLKYDRIVRSIKLYGQVVLSATRIQSQWRSYECKRSHFTARTDEVL